MGINRQGSEILTFVLQAVEKHLRPLTLPQRGTGLGVHFL